MSTVYVKKLISAELKQQIHIQSITVNTHAHSYIYIYIYVCVCESVETTFGNSVLQVSYDGDSVRSENDKNCHIAPGDLLLLILLGTEVKRITSY